MFKHLFLGLSLLLWAYPSLSQPTYTPEDVEQGKKYQAEALARAKAFKSNLNASHYQDLPAEQWLDGVKSAHFFLKNYFVPNKKQKTIHNSYNLFIYLIDIRQKKNELISYESMIFSLKDQVIHKIYLDNLKPVYKLLDSKYPEIYLTYGTTTNKYGGGQVSLSSRYFKVGYTKFFGSKDEIAYVLADKIVMKHKDFWLVASFVPQDNWDMDALQREIDAQQAEMDKEIAFLKPIAEARNEKEGAIIKASDAEKAAAKDAQQKEIYAYKNKTLAERAAYSAEERPTMEYYLQDKGQRFYLVKDMAGDYFLYNKANKACIAHFKYVDERYEGATLEGKALGNFVTDKDGSVLFTPKGKPSRVSREVSTTVKLYPTGELNDKNYIGRLSDDYIVRAFDVKVYEAFGYGQHQNLHFLYYAFFMQ